MILVLWGGGSYIFEGYYRGDGMVHCDWLWINGIDDIYLNLVLVAYNLIQMGKGVKPEKKDKKEKKKKGKEAKSSQVYR